MPNIPRMRTASGALEIIKEQDPKTAVTLHYIRYLIRTNKVPVAEVGRKKLVDADAVIDAIASGKALAKAADIPAPIRRVAP